MFGCIAPPRQPRNVMRSFSQDSREFHGDPRFQRPASVDLRLPRATIREVPVPEISCPLGFLEIESDRIARPLPITCPYFARSEFTKLAEQPRRATTSFVSTKEEQANVRSYLFGPLYIAGFDPSGLEYL
uniref:Uncharacterized protein n=1 Tax=Caenorhabditis japonica TaxID=281687 RepID=A0A8R1ISC7_CAEJA